MKNMTVGVMVEVVQRGLHFQQLASAQGLTLSFWRDRGVNKWEVRRKGDHLRTFDAIDELGAYLSGYREGRAAQ